MILSTHAIVGGAIASFLPSHPLLAVVAGFASHFAIDAIPHWDYPLQSIAIGKGADNRRLRLSRNVVLDLAVIALDAACAKASALALWLFATLASIWVDCSRRRRVMLPDPLQFAHRLFHEPLNTLQRFHGWIHAKRKLAWRAGHKFTGRVRRINLPRWRARCIDDAPGAGSFI